MTDTIITPEDVAKGMFDYMKKQSGKILISKEDFVNACGNVVERIFADDKKTPSPVQILLTLDRARFAMELIKELFDENKEE